MIRQTIIRSVKPSLSRSAPAYRSLSSTTARLAEGDTGSTRSGGVAQGDAFTKREAADESLWVKQKEMEKLEQLKRNIAEHQKQLDKLDGDINEKIEKGRQEGK